MSKAEFDKFAEDYRTVHTKNIEAVSGTDSDYFSEYKIAELHNRCIISDGSRILDLGCGDGNSSKYIGKYFANSEYVGIDVSSQSVEAAKQNHVTRYFFPEKGYLIKY